MRRAPRKETIYERQVWVNPTTEPLRKEECLCLNCKDMDKCVIHSELFKICIMVDTAFSMTRCPKWKVKGNQEWSLKV